MVPWSRGPVSLFLPCLSFSPPPSRFELINRLMPHSKRKHTHPGGQPPLALHPHGHYGAPASTPRAHDHRGVHHRPHRPSRPGIRTAGLLRPRGPQHRCRRWGRPLWWSRLASRGNSLLAVPSAAAAVVVAKQRHWMDRRVLRQALVAPQYRGRKGRLGLAVVVTVPVVGRQTQRPG